MLIGTGWSTRQSAVAAVHEAYERVAWTLGREPDLLLISFSSRYEAVDVLDAVRALAPNAQLHGGTGCLGAMTESGFHSDDGFGLGMFGLLDERGAYGVGAAERGADPRAAAALATRRALKAAKRPGEFPELVWLSGAPGVEEEFLLGIEDVIGSVPITGGSTADNEVAGAWKQVANDRVYADAVAVTVMFPSVPLVYAYQSGYSPTERSGRVTAAQGRRLISVDDRPAAEVYAEWTGLLGDLGQERQILDETSLAPLGRVVGTAGGLPYYQLSHPVSVTPDREMTLFSTIEVGDRIVQMQGSQSSLISRAGRVAASALAGGGLNVADVSGALVIYCAGCMLTARPRMEEVVAGLNEALGHKPLLGMFTFGEQGCFIGGENRHGNLMVSVVAFGRTRGT